MMDPMRIRPTFTVGDFIVDTAAGELYAVGELHDSRVHLPGMHKEGEEMPDVAALLRLRLNEPRRTEVLNTLPSNRPVHMYRHPKNLLVLVDRLWNFLEPAIDFDGTIVVPMVIASGPPTLRQVKHLIGVPAMDKMNMDKISQLERTMPLLGEADQVFARSLVVQSGQRNLSDKELAQVDRLTQRAMEASSLESTS